MTERTLETVNMLSKLSRESQVVLGGSVIYLLLSFLFDWQHHCEGGFCAGQSEWDGSGFGVIAGLVVLLLIASEITRMLDMKIAVGSLAPAFVQVALAALLLLFTVLAFLRDSLFRAWPEWLALILSVLIAVAAWRRGQGEGFEMPKMGSGAAASAAPAAPPAAPAAPEPAAPAEPAAADHDDHEA